MKKVTKSGYSKLMDIIRSDDIEADPYGTGMYYLFEIAEFLHHYGFNLPDNWEFRDSPLHDGIPLRRMDFNPEIHSLWCSYEIAAQDLLRAGNVLNRYTRLLDEK